METKTVGHTITIGAVVELPGNDADGRNWVAFVHNAHDRSVFAEVRGASQEEAVTNACLIAAAPELLEALEVANCEGLKHRSDCMISQQGTGCTCGHRDRVVMIRAAIAKATSI